MDERTCMIASSDYGFLWLDGVITPAVARMFQKCLDMMNRQECKAIILYIKGPGGDLWACSQMRNAIRASSRPVATVAHGRVASAHLMLTQAGRKRFALEGTRFQFHRSEVQIPDVLLNHGYVNEALCHGLLDHIAIANAISLAGLLEHGTSETVIGNLFATEADIDATRARRIRLIDGFYAHSDFRKDRGIVREIIRAKRVRKIKAA